MKMSTIKKRPKIAITLGDAAGVGPELCLWVLREPSVREICRPVILGDTQVLLDTANALGRHVPTFASADENAVFLQKNADFLLPEGRILPKDFTPGEVAAVCGAAAYACIRRAVAMCLSGEADAMVTAPIHKEALRLAHIPFPGHTEMLVAQTGAAQHVMMLTSEEITVALVTAHVGYMDVLRGLSVMRVLETIRLTAHAMRRIRGKQHIRLTVCGLNPHAGEHGLFGRGEEERILLPAIQQALAEESEGELEIAGPLPPDTAFLPHRRRETDAYICMTHDQGLIPLKMLAFDRAVNITLGLPVIRTSVDHGTAMDIVRTGKADPGSMMEAIRLAVRLANGE